MKDFLSGTLIARFQAFPGQNSKIDALK